MRIPAAFFILFLSACGGEAIDNNRAEDETAGREAPPALSPSAVPVRIGELGPSFPACNAVGTARRVESGTPLQLREAPFDAAAATGEVPSGARFAICSRSHDQKWFGIVFDGGSGADCGISLPVPRRAAYDGPCRSGWVSSALVRVVAGESPSPAAPEVS